MNTDLEITLEFLDSPTEVDFFAVAGAPGHDGQDGADGRDGADGHTPVITASKQGNTTTISVDGNPVAQILDGATGTKGDKGDKGDPGQDGAKGDKGDPGAKGDKGDKGDTGAQGIQGIQGDTGAKGDKGDKGDTGATGAAGQDGHTPVKGTDYWTAADKAEIVAEAAGAVDIPAVSSGAQVKGGSASSVFIAPSVEDAASFYGLAKAAGDITQSQSDNAVGTYTDDAKTSIRTMLGAVGDVLVGGNSIVNNGVATMPVAGQDRYGVVRGDFNYLGIGIASNGYMIFKEPSVDEIRVASNPYRALTVTKQHESTFYGLAKAAGDSTQSASSNTVGNYTDAAKVAIQKMLGIYQAPWELIREDTFTNEAEAAYDIIVDDNGQAFELTDVVLHLRAEGSGASKFGSYGQVEFFDLVKNKSAVLEAGIWDVASGGNRGCYFIAYQSNGLLMTGETQGAAGTAPSPLRFRQYVSDPSSYLNGFELAGQSPFVFSQIRIRSIKGSFKIEVFGKRKWQ